MNSLSLSELLAEVQVTLEDCLEPTYWVRAEISALSVKGGHCYMDLIEKGDNALMAAKMRATCWRNRWQMLQPAFEQATGQNIKVGMQVLLQVEVVFHPVYGLSLNIYDLDATFTLGDLERQRQETIRQLQADGVMDINRSHPFPTLPQRIAVISSESAAGYGDFCDQLKNNPGGYAFTPTLFPATMQGDTAAESIIRALNQIADRLDEFDVVVIIRGGGATTDMACFDNYLLASCCAQFPLPIISGIGHTRDVSIVDMVVHTAAKTPTAVAEVLITSLDRQAQILQDLLQRIRLQGQRQIEQRRAEIQLLLKTIQLHSPEGILRKGYALITKEDDASSTTQVLTKAEDAAPGDILNIEWLNSHLKVKVLD